MPMVLLRVCDHGRATALAASMPDTTKKTGIRNGSRIVVVAVQKPLTGVTPTMAVSVSTTCMSTTSTTLVPLMRSIHAMRGPVGVAMSG
jgi:hypothetical protein